MKVVDFYSAVMDSLAGREFHKSRSGIVVLASNGTYHTIFLDEYRFKENTASRVAFGKGHLNLPKSINADWNFPTFFDGGWLEITVLPNELNHVSRNIPHLLDLLENGKACQTASTLGFPECKSSPRNVWSQPALDLFRNSTRDRRG